MRYVLIDKYRKDLKRVRKTLEEKPATWELYEHEKDGKLKIFGMEIREFKHLMEEMEKEPVGKKEFYHAVKHVVASGLDLMYSIRESEDE